MNHDVQQEFVKIRKIIGWPSMQSHSLITRPLSGSSVKWGNDWNTGLNNIKEEVGAGDTKVINDDWKTKIACKIVINGLVVSVTFHRLPFYWEFS